MCTLIMWIFFFSYFLSIFQVIFLRLLINEICLKQEMNFDENNFILGLDSCYLNKKHFFFIKNKIKI